MKREGSTNRLLHTRSTFSKAVIVSVGFEPVASMMHITVMCFTRSEPSERVYRRRIVTVAFLAPCTNILTYLPYQDQHDHCKQRLVEERHHFDHRIIE